MCLDSVHTEFGKNLLTYNIEISYKHTVHKSEEPTINKPATIKQFHRVTSNSHTELANSKHT